jgi:hypothetical protein
VNLTLSGAVNCAIGAPNPTTLTITDDDVQGFVTVDQINVVEGSTAVFQVRLSNQPSANVTATVTWASGDTDITVQSGAGLTFTTADWNVDHPVTLAAAQDADIENGTAVIRIRASGVPDKDIAATEQDNDTQQIVTSANQVSIAEGSTADLRVMLSAMPSGNVTVAVAKFSGDADITVQSGASLIFNPSDWNIYKTVVLAAAEDEDVANGEAIIRLNADNVPGKDITAIEQDNDTLQFVTSVSTVNVAEGTTATFQVRLTAQPSATVSATVARASGDADITVQSGASLTFTTANWDTYQTVTLAAAEDMDTTNGTATIRVAATGIPNKDVTATEVDNDTLNFETNVSTVNVPEGSTATFQVRLTARPSADVNATVTRASGDTDITVQSGAALTFTTANWDTYQTVTLAAAEDVDTIDGTATIQVSGLGLPNKDLTAIEQDDDMDNGTIALVLDPSLSTSGMLVNAAVEISDNRQQLAVFGIDLVFSGTDFTYKSNEVGTLTANWSITVDSSTAGRLRIRGVGGTAIPASSSGSLVTVNLQVNCLSYAVPTLSPLLLENYTDDLLDGFLPLPSTANFTFTPCSLLGDVNADGSVTPGDAQEAFEIYLGILTPTFCQEMTSDGNCSRSTTPGDAQNIFEHYLGMISLPFCCAQAAAASSRATSLTSLLDLEEARVILRERGTRPPQSSKSIDRTGNRENDSRFRRTLYPLDTIGRPNEPVGVPVIVSNPSGLRTFGFDVLYPNDMLEYWGAKKTSLTKGFDYVLGTEESPGLIHVEAESQEAIPGSELGSLVLLTFRVREGADLSLPIQVLNPAMDLRDAEVSEGIFLRSGSRGMDLRWVSFGNPVSAGESLFRVPVLLNDLFGLKAFGFEVNYGPETAAFLGIRRPGLDDGLVDLRAREVEPGRVRVGGFRMSEDLRREPGVLVELVFRRNTTGAVISLEYLVDDLAKAAVTRGNLRLE